MLWLKPGLPSTSRSVKSERFIAHIMAAMLASPMLLYSRLQKSYFVSYVSVVSHFPFTPTNSLQLGNLAVTMTDHSRDSEVLIENLVLTQVKRSHFVVPVFQRRSNGYQTFFIK